MERFGWWSSRSKPIKACEDKESDPQDFIQQPAFSPALKTGARIDFKFLREDLNGILSFPAIRDADRNEFSLLELREDGSLCTYNGEKAVPLQKY